ncbi:hypothetical protein [Larkinella terrae]
MADRWKIMVAMIWMLLVLGVGSIMHEHKIQKTQIGGGLPVLLKMLNQIDQPDRLGDTKARD